MFYRHFNRIIAAALLAAALASAAFAKDVDLDRILREHQIRIVTTEQAESISKYVFEMRLKEHSIMTSREIVEKSKSLANGESVLFITDRSKMKQSDSQVEALMPCPTSAIGANQVILYAKKSLNRNAWEIQVSAPNEKWLQWELARLCTSEIRSQRLEERGSILDRYDVKRLCVVSTEGKQVAEDWISAQSKPGGDAIDWDFVSAELWKQDSASSTDIAFLLNRQKLSDKSELIPSLPKAMQTWLNGEGSKTELAMEKEVVQNGSAQPRAVYAIIAPCARHLNTGLNKHKSLETIQESLEQQRFHDLSSYDQVVVVARPGDRSQDSDSSTINDFAGKLTSALSSVETGFQCVGRQDLKELFFDTVPAGGDDKIDTTQLAKIRAVVGHARAIAIADLSALDVSTSYVANTPVCETDSYPAFTTPKPSEPQHPNADAVALFRGHIYRIINGRRENDPNYIRDHRSYHERSLPDYERAIRQWERAKEDYDDRRGSHEMDWRLPVDAVQSAKIAGNLRLYDISSADTLLAGQVIFSCSLGGEDEHRSAYKTTHAVVRGEENQPGNPDVPEARAGVADMTVVSHALQESCKAAVDELLRSAIVRSDNPVNKLPDPAVVVAETARLEHVVVEEIGTVKLDQRPTGTALSEAREAALADAYPKLIAGIKTACPDAVVSQGDARAGSRAVSEGWNAQTLEYRVKVRFEGDVSVLTHIGKAVQ